MIDVEALRRLAANLDAKTDVCDSDAQQAERIGGLDAAFRSGLAIAYRGSAARIRHILTSEATEHQEGPAMSSYTSMMQEVVAGLSRRGHSIDDRGSDWIVIEDENGRRFKVTVTEVPTDTTSGPVVDIIPDPRLHAHEVGGPYRDCLDCIAKAAAERDAG